MFYPLDLPNHLILNHSIPISLSRSPPPPLNLNRLLFPSAQSESIFKSSRKLSFIIREVRTVAKMFVFSRRFFLPFSTNKYCQKTSYTLFRGLQALLGSSVKIVPRIRLRHRDRHVFTFPGGGQIFALLFRLTSFLDCFFSRLLVDFEEWRRKKVVIKWLGSRYIDSKI